MAEVCPYCRESITEMNRTVCPACQTPHHEDCWGENAGCTVFGCERAPADEPKIAVAALETIRDQYFLARDGVQTGPFNLSYLQALIPAPASTLAWKEGMPTWVPLPRMLEREGVITAPLPLVEGMDPRPEVLKFGRGFYLLSCVVVWVLAVMVAASSEQGSAAAVLIFYALWFVGGTLRTRDVGFNGWAVLLVLVPLANIWLGFHLLFAPRGYAQTKKSDTAMKVSLWIVAGLIVAAFMAGLLAAWTK